VSRDGESAAKAAKDNFVEEIRRKILETGD
jgi:hypothetical protein